MFVNPLIETINVGNNRSIVINLMNGNADVVSDDIRLLLSEKHADFPNDVTNQLLDRGHIFLSEKEYEQQVSSLDQRLMEASLLEVPNFTYIVTYKCNLACYYCFENDCEKQPEVVTETGGPSSAVDAMSSLVRQFEARSNTKVNPADVMVTVTGGEPLMPGLKEQVDEFCRLCHGLGYTLSIVTNGCYTDDFVDIIKRYDIRNIQLTLDGPEPVHDAIRISPDGAPSYAKVVHSIDVLSKICPELYVRINVSERNIETLHELGPLIERYPGVVFYVYLMQDDGCEKSRDVIPEPEALERLCEQVDQYPSLSRLVINYHGQPLVEAIFDGKPYRPKCKMCSAMQNQYIFDYTGRVFKCWWEMGNKDYAIGRYSNGDLFIDSARCQIYLKRNIGNLGQCKTCRYRYLCGGGCIGHLSPSDLEAGRVNCPEFSEILGYMVKRRYSELGGD